MSADCIFCTILAGEIPCTKIYEDDKALAFLDIGPIIKGHTLVIPRTHHDPISQTPDSVLQHLITIVRKIACAQMHGLGADGINVSQANGASAGREVPHIHFHVIPRFDDDGHSWNWKAGTYDSPDEMEQFAEKLRNTL